MGFRELVLDMIVMWCFVGCKRSKLVNVGVDVGGLLSMVVRLWGIGDVEHDMLLRVLTSLIVCLLVYKVGIDEGMRRDGEVRGTSSFIEVGRDLEV